MYDYLVVGAVFAHEAVLKGKKVKVIEKNHIAGNIYTREEEGIQVHQYGAHIFHTSDKEIWDYVNQFAEFNRYINSPVANYKGEIYNLPFNMNTFNKLWGVVTPAEAQAKIDEQRAILNGKTPENLEEQAISLVATDIYEKLIKDYTEKQWGKPTTELPSFIIVCQYATSILYYCLPVRLTYDNNYFNDTYQGIPIGRYTQIVEKCWIMKILMMLDHENIDVETNVDFFVNKEQYLKDFPKIVFTGMIDEFFDYKLGELEYRSLRFENETLDMENYQGNAVVNYTDAETPYTRIIEHKHFEFGSQAKTIITKEHSKTWEKGDEPYYPVNNDRNNHLYKSYKKLADEQGNVIFGGRLGHYRYYDIHQVIGAALQCVRNELN
uniref:UDP-galactopyranose mutase Glf n=1 Tax=Streptococcus pneumoniae TaxID=1313 RepID=Q4K0V9_STREE|nr:UDP-galactopyranose mutase Glf [Streptococcus pneumoniae]